MIRTWLPQEGMTGKRRGRFADGLEPIVVDPSITAYGWETAESRTRCRSLTLLGTQGMSIGDEV